MPTVELPTGHVDYLDTETDGPVLVLCHGLPMDHRQWRKVIPLLSGFRVIAPTLPMGAHRTPMRADADLSQAGMANVLADFLEALDLSDVTLVLNDWGGGQFVITEGRDERVGRMVLVACEAFDNFPPGGARTLAKILPVPGAPSLFLQLMRIRQVRQAPSGYGGMSVSPLPDDLLRDWFAPATENAEIRRDFVKFATGAPDRATLLKWSAQLSSFTRPVLVVWAAQDRLMPADHGPRLAGLYPNADLVVIEDSSTLVPEDQPERLAELITDFVPSSPPEGDQ